VDVVVSFILLVISPSFFLSFLYLKLYGLVHSLVVVDLSVRVLVEGTASILLSLFSSIHVSSLATTPVFFLLRGLDSCGYASSFSFIDSASCPSSYICSTICLASRWLDLFALGRTWDGRRS
jgi:hypothetical protein